MAGHTHEDVDQLFSRISSGLAKRDAHTLPQLLEAIETSATPKPVCRHLQSLYDYRGQLIKTMGLVDGIMTPHHFKFELVNDKVIMFYKDWLDGRGEYRSLNIDTTSFLWAVCGLLPSRQIRPQLRKMEQDLSKWADCGCHKDEEVRWWRTYLESCKSNAKRMPNVPKVSSLGQFKTPRISQAEDGKITNLV